jgi:hypothetical protein
MHMPAEEDTMPPSTHAPRVAAADDEPHPRAPRNVIEPATGVLMRRFRLGAAEADYRLRRYASARGLTLAEAAGALLAFEELFWGAARPGAEA